MKRGVRLFKTVAVVIFVLFIIASFAGSTLLHAVVPHEHVLGGEVLWQEMHAALRHDDKKALPPLFVSWTILVLGILAISRGIIVRTFTLHREDEMLLVKRGIALYRRFG